LGGRKSAATRTINAYEIGVAEATNSRFSILFQSRPKVAASEPTKDGSAASIRSFAL